MEAHYLTSAFHGSRRGSKRRLAYSFMRLIVRCSIFWITSIHALVKGTVYFIATLGDEIVDHFSNRKYPRG